MADPTLITPNSRNSDRVSFILDTDWKTVLGDSYEETFLKYETTFDFTSYNNTWNSREVEPTNSTGDCQKSLLGTINVSIDKFFTFLKTVKKYEKLYVQGMANKVADLQRQINKVTGSVAAVLRILVSSMRNFLMKQLRKIVDRALEYIMPDLAASIKDSIIELILDQIFCILDAIIAGLQKFVGDFLFALLGQIINTPFCAIERWTNALINSLVNKIDNALSPIFDKINDIISGVAKVTGSVMSIINKILAFEGLFCQAPNCKEATTFSAKLNKTFKKAEDDFGKFHFIDPKFAGEIEDTAQGWMDNAFGKDVNEDVPDPYLYGGSCYAGDFSCGVPEVVLFGGGGSGAVATAIVNNIGQIIGTNILNPGGGYQYPPFVSIVDPADCGNNAGGYAEIEDGIVTDIIITNPGYGYDNTNNGGPPVIHSFYASPNPVNIGQTVTLSWDVMNADSVSLNIPGYNDLAPIGNILIPITPDSVVFEAATPISTLTYTLTASKQNIGSGQQTSQRDYILTVNDVGVSPPSGEPNTNPPVIDLFSAEPGESNESIGYSLPGDVITLTWQTTNATNVSLDVDGYSVLTLDGAASVIIPSDIEIPDGQGGVSVSYTLTATNVNALPSNQTVTNTVTILVKENPDSQVTSDPETVTVPAVGAGVTVSDPGGNAVPIITDVIIINTGIGYTAGDSVTVGPGSGGEGAEFDLNVNPLGQVIGVNVINSGFGYSRIPEIRINSIQGVGAAFRTKMKFIPLNQFLEDQKMLESELDPNKLVQVIDCV